MGDRDSENLGRCHRRADTWDHLRIDAGFREGCNFLPSPAEHKGIAALKADDEGVDICILHQKRVYLLLGFQMSVIPLADRHQNRPILGLQQKLFVEQPVVDNHVGSF